MTEQPTDDASPFEAARARLLALAYRMLGSRADAEDVVQDVWLKWRLADTRDVQTPAAWLTTLVTRTAIDRLRHAQRERALQTSAWLPEPWLDDLAPSAEEPALRASQMSYGVMLLLERLKPDERAAFVLHEAFDCDYAEIGRMLERTPAACRQMVHRAKTRLRRAGTPLDRPDPAGHARIVERLRIALDAQDRAGMLRVFSDAPDVVSDEPVAASVAAIASASGGASRGARQPITAQWVDALASLARRANTVDAVSIDGAPGIALLRDGDVVGLLDVTATRVADGSTKIVGLRIVTGAAGLYAANRVFGRAAIMRLLARIQREARASVSRVPAARSIAMSRDFPVDIDA